jgi:hypothetical protein
MTDGSPKGRRPYFKSITCYQQDIGWTTTGGVSIARRLMFGMLDINL